MTDRSFRVVMLCTDGLSSRVLYHALSKEWDIAGIIVERRTSLRSMMARRVQRIGVCTVVGQLLFGLLNFFLSRLAWQRIDDLLKLYGLINKEFPAEYIQRVPSVNSPETIRLFKELKPDAVVVNGTRILSREVLKSVSAPFVNTHMGITPRYRGVHGSYWALANNDAEHCGVTVHLVDGGIDTGGILYQGAISTTSADNFNTYPIHQIAIGIPLMEKALNDVRREMVCVKDGSLPSKLWSHPTLAEYIYNWAVRRVK